ncbi:rho GTPase-activating protein 9-like isoform X2 [Maniola hyperantus]|uniref:rho GTPase-activating protein 9-like isoform X2 n=1 Tax=Aphantopus hyperantus TaxID=2795564 RepID=UPI00156A4FBF|nr:rho GTPase-activating protein 9-like isoform X1 [Maniola hyperantus]
MCEVTSWIPHAVVETLRDRSAQPVIAWLTSIRASIEEYDPLIVVRPPSSASENSESDGAFDEILSQLGKEIFKLDEYQRNLTPSEKQDVSLSILNIFDECLEGMSHQTETETKVISELKPKHVSNENKTVQDCSDSSVSDVSLVSNTSSKSVKVTRTPPPVPPRKFPIKTPVYDNMEFKDNFGRLGADKLESDTDSASTCWSYQDCNIENPEGESKDAYAAVWSHSTGFHNSDEILRHVLSQAQQRATISRLSFDTASDFSPQPFSVYALHEVGEIHRCDPTSQTPVVEMTPDKPCDDGYEPVRDAINLTDENIYEEIEYGYSYTDEGCSCGGSVEVESCSISNSSEGVGRESPLYANLRDHDAYAIPPDVIFWKNLLLDPFYNDDEEDEWITPEECELYSRERRPPLVIPRITQYRPPPRRDPRPQIPLYTEDRLQDVPDKSWNWSPTSERSRIDIARSFNKANCESPPFWAHKRLGGSTENLLTAARRPNHLQLPPSSSGDSLDVEVREREPGAKKERKSRSMVAPKQKPRPPVVPQRVLIHPPIEAPVIFEGPMKRTKFMEGGKKSKKNWTDCYMILTPTKLVFYKDQRSYDATRLPKPNNTPPSPTAPRAELELPLLNAHVVQCIQQHTRRFMRSLLLTVEHDQYLLQDFTEEGAIRLLKCIQNVIYKLGPPPLDDRPSPYQSSNTDLESLGRTPPVSRHATRSKQKAGGSSNEDLSDSTEVSIQRSHVRSRLRKFFAKRPAMDVLVKKGIYKDEPVFGRKLEEVCPASSPRVPDFVKACVKEIESSEENLSTDGLYRASGNLSQVQKIRLEIDQNNLSVIENNTDIHVLTGSLKLFFRELKEPLIPCTLFDRILAACSIKPRDARVKEFQSIIQALPQCNRDTLKFLLEHLLKVTQYSERNRMHTANLAIVFGPTLLWAPEEQKHNIAIDYIQQNNVVDILLNEFKDIFVEETKGKKKA